MHRTIDRRDASPAAHGAAGEADRRGGPARRRSGTARDAGTWWLRCAVLAAASASPTAHASLLSGDALDTAADVLAWVVLVIAPIIAIALFLIVHVLPEKIAEKRHHPQKAAIQTLCLLSLVFGGLLWPLAWLWAYTRPTQYRLAYGTDRADTWFAEMGEKLERGELSPVELEALRDELDATARRRALPAELRALRQRLVVERDASGAVAASVSVSDAERATSTTRSA